MIRIALVLGFCLTLAACQHSLPIAAARTLGTEMLLRAADPRNTDYQIGLVNTDTTSAFLLPLPEAPLTVSWITGAEGAIWTQLAGQLADGANRDALAADVMRYVVTPASCPDLDDTVAMFHAAFAQYRDASPRLGYEPPPAGETGGARSDGPRYVIQYVQGDTLVRLAPGLAENTPLTEASTALNNLINACGAVDGFRDRIE